MTTRNNVLTRSFEAGSDALLAAAEGGFGADQVAICACLHDRPLTEADPGPFAAQEVRSHRGTQQIYPASVCKMFYLASLAAAQAAGRILLDDEDHRVRPSRQSAPSGRCRLVR